VLERGYAMAFAADGAIVIDAARLSKGDGLTLRFARGGAAVQVQALLRDGADDGNDDPQGRKPPRR
jgi:exonuclease VII large subunit